MGEGAAGEQRSPAQAAGRVGAIDGLRALAVAAVVAYHLGHLPGGWVGVDVFFVLSGYLITSLLLTGRRSGGGLDLRGFWGRRARRLLPASLACIVGTLAVGAVVEPDAVGAWARTGAASALWVGNWQQVLAGGSYFDGFGAPNALKHLWSLSVEEQMYLLWPLVLAGLVWALRRRSAATVAVAVGATALGLAALSAVAGLALAPATGEDPTRVWFGTDTRAVTPLVGAALAGVVAIRGWPSGRLGRALATASGAGGLAVLAVVATRVEDQDPGLWRGGTVVVALASAAVVAAAARPGPLQRVLGGSRSMTWSGRALSYALYLWHWPVIVLLSPGRTGLDGVALDGLRVGVAVGLSVASWRFVEHPFRAGAPRLRPAAGRAAVRLATASVAVVVAGAVLLGATHPTTGERMQALQVASSGQTVVAPSPAPSGGTARETSPIPDPRVSVYGDSVAWTFSVGATPELMSELGVSELRNHAGWGCQLLVAPRRSGDRVDPADSGCADWEEAWAASVAAERPDIAVLSVGVWEVFDRQLDGTWQTFGSPEHDAHLVAALDRALSVLGAEGARVVVTTAAYPERPADGLSPIEWTDRNESRARFDHLNELLRSAARRNGATVVDMDELWCTPEAAGCRAEPRRYDGVHFDPDTAAGPVLGFLLEQLGSSARATVPARGG